MSTVSVLIVEDEEYVRKALKQWLTLSGFETATVSGAREALDYLETNRPTVIVSDVRMPRHSGLDLLTAVRAKDASISVILITGHGDVPMAVAAIKDGAFDFLQKPFEPEQLVEVINRAAVQTAMFREIHELGKCPKDDDLRLEQRLIGASEPIKELRSLVRAIASVDTDVVILGETGTGKEVVAGCIHDLSNRSSGPFVAVNCAAIPSELIESELFGHEAGSFTGSAGRRIGKFEFANGGTLFLDEIESMPLLAQAKVLRVIQERVVERVAERMVSYERRVIENELRRHKNSVTEVCAALGVPRRTLSEKMLRLGVQRDLLAD